jgi:membrane protein implicated in regulation of membrane protease activity
MQPHLTAIRAIAIELVLNKLGTLALIVAAVGLIDIVALIVLANFGLWWLIPLLLLFPIVAVCLAMLLMRLIMRMVKPDMNTEQSAAVLQFVKRVDAVTEHIGTPQFIIVFRLFRDALRPRETSYLQTVIGDGTGLRTDYQKIVTLFK